MGPLASRRAPGYEEGTACGRPWSRSRDRPPVHLTGGSMAKRVKVVVKLQLPAGKATPAYPVGPALGQHGINIMGFCKEYNERTPNPTRPTIPPQTPHFHD